MQESKTEQTKTAANPADRRRFPRYPVDVEVKVVREGSDGVNTFFHGRRSEVGEGGLAVFVAHEFTLGDVVRVITRFPYSTRPLECHAVVRNRDSYCYGMEFVGLGEGEREFIARTCRFLAMIQEANAPTHANAFSARLARPGSGSRLDA